MDGLRFQQKCPVSGTDSFFSWFYRFLSLLYQDLTILNSHTSQFFGPVTPPRILAISPSRVESEAFHAAAAAARWDRWDPQRSGSATCKLTLKIAVETESGDFFVICLACGMMLDDTWCLKWLKVIGNSLERNQTHRSSSTNSVMAWNIMKLWTVGAWINVRVLAVETVSASRAGHGIATSSPDPKNVLRCTFPQHSFIFFRGYTGHTK